MEMEKRDWCLVGVGWLFEVFAVGGPGSEEMIPLISDQPRDSSVSECPLCAAGPSERSVRSLLRVLGRAVENVVLSHQTKGVDSCRVGFSLFGWVQNCDVSRKLSPPKFGIF
jgi:hypothetical protein